MANIIRIEVECEKDKVLKELNDYVIIFDT